ncbi:hypothetical protein [Candidatus Binatus sp.]|uniref:hypothetical protein n=1 Tax=Candidatus Binatus sp. TaxID=2811406 RepID=UPI002F94552E
MAMKSAAELQTMIEEETKKIARLTAENEGLEDELEAAEANLEQLIATVSSDKPLITNIRRAFQQRLERFEALAADKTKTHMDLAEAAETEKKAELTPEHLSKLASELDDDPSLVRKLIPLFECRVEVLKAQVGSIARGTRTAHVATHKLVARSRYSSKSIPANKIGLTKVLEGCRRHRLQLESERALFAVAIHRISALLLRRSEQ